MEKETIKALAETTARATAAALTVKNAIELDYFLSNYAGKIRLLDGKGDSIQISTPKGEYRITRIGFGPREYRVEKV